MTYSTRDEAYELFERGQFGQSKRIFEHSLGESVNNDHRNDILFNLASCQASEGDLESALIIFEGLDEVKVDLLYNKALCHYLLQRYEKALELINRSLNICRKECPELFIQNSLLPDAVRNKQELSRFCFVELLNLKSAVIFRQTANCHDSKICLQDLLNVIPASDDLNLRHNLAIYETSSNIESSFHLLKGLADSHGSSYPRVLLRNLILIALNGGLLNEAKECWIKYRDELSDQFTESFSQFVEIQIDRDHETEEATYARLDNCLKTLLEGNVELDDEVSRLISIVSSEQALFLWDANQYELLERLLLKFKSILKDYPSWKINLAHTLFMMDSRYEESVKLYEALLPKSPDQSLLSVDPMILANLSVSYVLAGQNGKAEILIEDVQNDESEFMSLNSSNSSTALPDSNLLNIDETGASNSYLRKAQNYPPHLSIINIVIGTLYCAKNNYEFGLMRVFKALEPLESKLNGRTWYHAKRCLLGALDRHLKHIIFLKDEIFDRAVEFLMKCEKQGVLIETNLDGNSDHSGRSSVTYEARYLRYLILCVVHN